MRPTTLRYAASITPKPLATSSFRTAPTSPSAKAVAEQLLSPVPLYRRLLRVHRKALPIEMRVMGDEYIKVGRFASWYMPLYRASTRTGIQNRSSRSRLLTSPLPSQQQKPGRIPTNPHYRQSITHSRFPIRMEEISRFPRGPSSN